jgi:hypothetical protein
MVARWSLNPLGMLWPETDAVFGAMVVHLQTGRIYGRVPPGFPRHGGTI